jgi:hypothetical protein
MPNDLHRTPAAHPSPPSAPAVPAPYSEASFIPVATPRTRALRTFLPWQLWRFVVINVRMLRMIAKSHE